MFRDEGESAYTDDIALATPEEKHQLLRCMFESLYVEFRTGQIVEVVPRPGFRWVLEAAEITRPPGAVPDDPLLVIGDPEGIRTPDLHRDRVAC